MKNPNEDQIGTVGKKIAKLRTKGNELVSAIELVPGVAELRREIDKIGNKIQKLIDTCPHENVKKTYKGDTGNWCKDDDSYWIEFDCPDCGKRWHEDQ